MKEITFTFHYGSTDLGTPYVLLKFIIYGSSSSLLYNFAY